MKLRNQVLAVVSPIIFIGLAALAFTLLVLMKERREAEFSSAAFMAHKNLVQSFSDILNRNDNDIFLLTHVEKVNKLLHNYVVGKSQEGIRIQLHQALSSMYQGYSAELNPHWVILTSDGTELAHLVEQDKQIKNNEGLTKYLPSDVEQVQVQRLITSKRRLRALTIHDMTDALIVRFGGKVKNRIYVAVSRIIPPPFDVKSQYDGMVHIALNRDNSLSVYSPLNNPVKGKYTVDQLHLLADTSKDSVFRQHWSDFDVFTLVDLSYAFDWKRTGVYIFLTLLASAALAISVVLLVLNRAVITPVTWLSNHISSGEVFRKPDKYPPLGSNEIKSLYRGIVKSTRKLESVRMAMEEASLLDELTGLGNRRQFHKTLARVVAASRRKNKEFALLLIDLDNFKYVNDAYGHEVGDKLLTKFAHLLNENTRSDDALYNLVGGQHISRLGGDEFAIVLNDLASPTNSALVAERIVAEMNRGIVVDGVQMPVTSSIGIAIFPNDADNSKDLMLCVDAAMYKAKHQGKNGYYFYSKQIASQLAKELEIEEQLRKDFPNNKLELFVQPFYRANDLQLAGGEVLLRWYNNKLGMVSPGEFIPIAEKIGLIRNIDTWVIEKVCQYIQKTKAEHDFDLTGIAINVSALETRNPKFASNVAEICAQYDVKPDLLELEITETALIEDLDAAAEVTEQLKSMGIRIALDDFGTGYSSISHLKDVKFDKLKIDRSFVAEIDDKKEAFLVADISLLLAHGMNMEITAEGVETESQLNYLKLSGCDYVQGFKFAKPMPMYEYIELSKPR